MGFCKLIKLARVHMGNFHLTLVGSRQNQVRSHLGGLALFLYEHIIFSQEFLKESEISSRWASPPKRDSSRLPLSVSSVFLHVPLFFLTSASFFFLFFQRVLFCFSVLLVKYFSVEQNQSPGGVLGNRRLKHLAKHISKQLYRSLFFQ